MMSQRQNNKPEIRTLEDLQKEKLILRSQITEQEKLLSTHYKSLKEKIKPALNIVTMLSRNKLLNLINLKGNDGKKGDLANMAIKIIMAAAASGLIFKNSKKNFMKSILAYAMDQSVKYIGQKDLSEHIEKIKEWFAKKEKDVDEDIDEPSKTE